MKKPVDYYEKLRPSTLYHIFNKSISSDKLFVETHDYLLFLSKLKKYILPVAEILSYCLIPNHFHLLIEIRGKEIIQQEFMSKRSPEKLIAQQFSNFFNSYAKSFNANHGRAGRLFLYPFKRIEIDDSEYLRYLICYIHRNPIHHGLAYSYSSWDYSSFESITGGNDFLVHSKRIIGMYGSKENFLSYHQKYLDILKIDVS